MGVSLTDADEFVHEPGPQESWNESRYVDFCDRHQNIAGWLRIGMRPNSSYAEMSVCVYLPDGRIAYMFERAPIAGNQLAAGGQAWEVEAPYETNHVRHHGQVLLLADGWALTNPGPAFRHSPKARCEIRLTVTTRGRDAVMGSDQDHIGRILLPGQADFHYQHLAWTIGTVRIGSETWHVEGTGGKDHSWGPRNWHAKTYLRWLTATFDDGSGFMLMRAVGPTKQTRGGHVWTDDSFELVDDFTALNHYEDAPYFELSSTDVSFRAAGREWSIHGRPHAWLPLRHRQQDVTGTQATLRIVKSPAVWTRSDGIQGSGACEFHDLMIQGKPIGLND